jgi:hypothetical protein
MAAVLFFLLCGAALLADTALSQATRGPEPSARCAGGERMRPVTDAPRPGRRVVKRIEADGCQAQRDGSTWCDLWECDAGSRCVALARACVSDRSGADCDGDEVEDTVAAAPVAAAAPGDRG